jgi:hypothetical protein
MKPTLSNQLESAYLDYVNNFLSVRKFADHYGLTENEANIIIDAGRKINQNKFL